MKYKTLEDFFSNENTDKGSFSSISFIHDDGSTFSSDFGLDIKKFKFGFKDNLFLVRFDYSELTYIDGTVIEYLVKDNHTIIEVNINKVELNKISYKYSNNVNYEVVIKDNGVSIILLFNSKNNKRETKLNMSEEKYAERII